MDAFVQRLPKPKNGRHDKKLVGEADEPPSKKLKSHEIPDSEAESSDDSSLEDSKQSLKIDHAAHDEDAEQQSRPRPTDVENVLPATQDEEEAIKEYQNLKLSQASSQDGTEAKAPPLWVKGRSSIYVDAFLVALDTVLEDESHLFDEREKEIFRQWKGLDYSSQYLYVRLFLRKTDSWFRSNRLGYDSDVANLEEAIQTLQSLRELPNINAATCSQESSIAADSDETAFGETFTFADASEDHIKSVEEAAPLLSLDELKFVAKDAKVNGRNKAEIVRALCRMSQQQRGLMSLGLSRHNSRDSAHSEDQDLHKADTYKAELRREDSNRKHHFLNKILTTLGPCIRLSPLTYRLFERVHLVFYRSTEWTEKSLTTIILAKIARRNFPEYVVCRTSTIFASQKHLREFERAIKLEAEVDRILEFGEIPGEAGYERVLELFEQTYPRWKELITEEETKEKVVYEMGEGAYLRRFTPAHSYTRIVHKALAILARRKEYIREHGLLTELLDQKLFHMARRGSWYQRKALLEEHYMPTLGEDPISDDLEQRKKHWKRVAVETCETGLQDPDCHLIYHFDLQKRLTKLEKKLRIPKRLQHDFGHVRLADPIEISVEGVQIKRELPTKPGRQVASTKTIWLDENSGEECSVEEMCLSHFCSEGWKGYHAEGGIVRTLFAYLFYDILFLYIPNVFQTAYQTCPLDLHTDAFFPARASEINHRLVEIENGQGQRLVREAWDREHERRTSVVGLNWDFEVDDILELVASFEGSALAAICKVMAQEYRQRGGGIPDLILWRRPHDEEEEREKEGEEEKEEEEAAEPGKRVMKRTHGHLKPGGEVMFAEVKSANDRLSDTQRLWIHVLTGAGVKVALCNAIAREVRELDQPDVRSLLGTTNTDPLL